jgi:hypothetical protein
MSIDILKIVKCSGPSEYEYLTFELQLGSEPIVAIDQEKGINALEVELFGVYKGYGTGMKVGLDDLIDKLIEARNYIREINQSKL